MAKNNCGDYIKNIVILGNEFDDEIYSLIKKTFPQQLFNPHIRYNKAITPQDIIVLKSSFCDTSLILPQNCTVIADSRNDEALTMLSLNKCYSIFCGTSSADMLSLSSYCPNFASVSLQRSITTLNNLVIDPCEIPVKYSAQINQYPIMVCTSLKLLSGIDCLGGMYL